MKVAVPQVNTNAPQGTAIFQTYYEYNYGKLKSSKIVITNSDTALPTQMRNSLEEKFRDSVKHLTNKLGGMGKDCKDVHREQKPSSKH
jgi:hypothetical protein